MKVLYISALSSEKLISDIYAKTQTNPGFAVQKFSRLLVKGLVHNDAEVISISNAPITREYTKRLWINLGRETEESVAYRYMPFVNVPILKHICIFVCSFFYVLIWGLKYREDKAIICDVLCVSSSIGSLLASKLCGLRSVAVVTDIYDQMVGQRTRGFKTVIKKLAGILNKKYVGLFDRYILLTEDMNAIVNPKKRPFIVMEALCDEKLSDVVWESADKSFPKVIMYAGGLEEKYGLKMLVQAFRTISDDNIELHLYGSGSYVEELVDETKEDRRIKFWGVKSNEEIMDAESKATLLVNPRFTTEEFTRYSFPSKNMEYMVSGTPLLTTKLPGMPKEYYPFVYLLDDESVEGYARAIIKTLKQSDESLAIMGRLARKFVLDNKNNIIQARRIINLVCDI